MKFKTKRYAITFLPPVIVIAVVILKKYIFALSDFIPACKFYTLTGFLCPGCGNTRASKEMLSFHFFTAIRYNATLPIISVFLLLLYSQYIISAWIKPVKLVPQKPIFYITAGILLAVYFVVRNFINFMP